jgi:N4-gp56 family major capsid protein
MSTITSGNSLASQIVNYYDKTLMEMLEANRVLVFHQHGQKKTLPKNEGNAVIWHRWNSFGKGRYIAESGAGTSRGISASKVSANIWMMGDHAIITTYIDMISINPVVEGAIKLFAQSGAWTLDFCIGRKLLWSRTALSGTFEVSATNGYVGARNLISTAGCASASQWNAPMWIIDNLTTRSTTFSAMNGGSLGTALTPNVLRSLKLKFKVKNCMPFPDGYYRIITHPDIVNQLRGTSAYIDLHKYTESGVKTFESGVMGNQGSAKEPNGLAGIMEGFKFFETPEAPMCSVTNAAMSAHGGGRYYFSFLFGTVGGESPYGVTDFDGGIKTFVKVPGPQSTDNPLNLYSKVGYRFIAAAKVLNTSACMWLAHGKPTEVG